MNGLKLTLFAGNYEKPFAAAALSLPLLTNHTTTDCHVIPTAAADSETQASKTRRRRGGQRDLLLRPNYNSEIQTKRLFLVFCRDQEQEDEEEEDAMEWIGSMDRRLTCDLSPAHDDGGVGRRRLKNGNYCIPLRHWLRRLLLLLFLQTRATLRFV